MPHQGCLPPATQRRRRHLGRLRRPLGLLPQGQGGKSHALLLLLPAHSSQWLNSRILRHPGAILPPVSDPSLLSPNLASSRFIRQVPKEPIGHHGTKWTPVDWQTWPKYDVIPSPLPPSPSSMAVLGIAYRCTSRDRGACDQPPSPRDDSLFPFLLSLSLPASSRVFPVPSLPLCLRLPFPSSLLPGPHRLSRFIPSSSLQTHAFHSPCVGFPHAHHCPARWRACRRARSTCKAAARRASARVRAAGSHC